MPSNEKLCSEKTTFYNNKISSTEQKHSNNILALTGNVLSFELSYG